MQKTIEEFSEFMPTHRSLEELNEFLDAIGEAPSDSGVVKAIAVRPEVDDRQSLEECEVDLEVGVVGDNWSVKGREPSIEAQVTIMNWRAIDAIAPDEGRWILAGDQFFVDMDLSEENLPPGQQIELGTVVLEISKQPHNGCKKFANRFGKDAVRFVNSPKGKQMHLRGLNARVVRAGRVGVGDSIRKVSSPSQPT